MAIIAPSRSLLKAVFCVISVRRVMTLLLLEALLAMMVLIFIVWWTMFSGRKKGEIKPAQPPATPEQTVKDEKVKNP